MLQGNRPFAVTPLADHVTCRRLDTGHLVFDGPLGRRILLTDPDGHPLHECEWRECPDGTVHLVSARWYLDWGQWVGLKPGGLVNTRTLDLTTRPGWQTLTRQDLRVMAARAMNVALAEVEYFYADDDLVIESTGQATIRQRKDALYMLEDGAFTQARFMSCMSAMRWASIDYLPVVELFQSLLPGTGSAAFELIRGLYDDQNREAPRPLRYRGIPTYPSEAAFSLFSNFFTARHRGQAPPATVFMDASRSHEVEWLPAPHPPVRHVAPHHGICLTVKHGHVRKATSLDDTSGLPFVPPNRQGFAPGGKRLAVHDGQLWLTDHRSAHEIPLDPGWGVTQNADTGTAPGAGTGSLHGHSWEDMFPDGPPVVSPREACSAILLYPEDESVIGDLASQPFVADFWHDLVESDPSLATHIRHDADVLIHGFDACITALPVNDCPSVTILYAHGAHAQKQAQGLWNQFTRHHQARSAGPPAHRPAHRFVSDRTGLCDVYQARYDLMCVWLPFAAYDETAMLRESMQRIHDGLRRNGLVWLAGPDSLPALLSGLDVDVVGMELVSTLQSFALHKSILPRATLHPRLHAWILKKC